MLSLAVFSGCARSPATRRTIVVSSAQLRRLTSAQIRTGTAVRLEGILTYFDLHSAYCFVQDDAGGVRVELAPGQKPPPGGSRVRVSGLAAAAGWAPSVVAGRVTAIQGEAVWQPVPISGQRLRDPTYQYRTIVTTGVVRSVYAERPGLMTLEIRSQAVTLAAKIPASAVEINDRMIDGEVRTVGVLAEPLTGEDAASPVLWVSDARGIAVVRPFPQPDALPVSQIRTLARLDRTHLPAHRVRVHGAPYVTTDGQAAVMDENGQIPVRMAQAQFRTDRAELDVAGFVVWEHGRAMLDHAVPVHTKESDQPAHAPVASSVLTTAIAVRRMSAAAAQLARPVRLRAVVTFFDPVDGLLFVQDATDGIFVQLSDPQHTFVKAGDAVEVTGVTTADFAPNVGKAELKVVGHPGLPEPGMRSLGIALGGNQDSRWIELPGIVQHVAQEPADSLVTLVWGRERYKAHVLGGPGSLAQLVDAQIRIRGVCGSLFNSKRQLLGIQLFVPGPESITVVQKPGSDPSWMPPEAVADLMRFSVVHQVGRRVRLRGAVTYANRDGVAWIRDATGGVMIQDLGAESLMPGDLVDVVGFPAIAGFSPVLRGVTLRKLAAGQAPQPVRISAQDAIRGDFDGQLVEVEGRLIDQLHQPAEHVLAMESGGTIFNANLPGGAPLDVEPGMLLRVSGICTVEVEQTHDLILPRDFHILLRSPSDVTVLRRPRWLTQERVAPVLGGATALLIAALMWAALLRQRVRKQTRALRTQTIQVESAYQRTRDALRKVSEAESFNRQSNGILELIARDVPVEAIADRIAQAVARHVDDSVCAVLLAESHQLRVCAVPALPAGWSEALARLDIASVACGGEFQECQRLSDDTAWREFAASGSGSRFRVFCASPISVDGVPAGAIAAFFRTGKPPADAQAMQLASWCNMAALALDRGRLHDELSFRAGHDMLTELPNRTLLYERMEQEIAQAASTDGLVGLLYIDLDGFKNVNDTLGHDAGDAVLRQAARRMTHCVRQGDTVARIGGDEFVVLLPDLTRKEDAQQIAAKLGAALSEPIYLACQAVIVTASMGVSVWPLDGDQPDHLLRFADTQMYQEKRCRSSEAPLTSTQQAAVQAASDTAETAS